MYARQILWHALPIDPVPAVGQVLPGLRTGSTKEHQFALRGPSHAGVRVTPRCSLHHQHHAMLSHYMDECAAPILTFHQYLHGRKLPQLTGKGFSPSAFVNNSNERRKWKLETLPRQLTLLKRQSTLNVAQVDGSRTVAGHQQTRMSCCQCLSCKSHLQNCTAML
jgi:hypothetical protein